MSDVTGWAHVCEEFEDLRRGTVRYGLSEQFARLDTDEGRAPDRLAEWSALRATIARARDDEANYGKHPLDGDLARELDWQGIPEEPSAAFACPDGRCARREEAIYDEPPPCDLQRRPMKPM
ncbi:hypothetical protein [Dactylosporangium sp. CA-233914]|uniref:hypothetical protein n=1 Tax=Dactylosporangium sp. CA-233914 TaxID=3239934 RepID=UPI003D8E792D